MRCESAPQKRASMFVYGPLHLSVQGAVAFVLVTIAIWLAALWSFRHNQLGAGVAFYIASFALLIFVLATGWSMVNIMALNGSVAVWAMIGSIVAPSVWVLLAIRCFCPKQKVSNG